VELLLAVGLAALAMALLILSLAVLPAGPGRVPLSRLDPSYAPPTSALAGAGAVAGAAVERVLVKRGRLAAGAAALERAGMSATLPDVVLVVALLTIGVGIGVTLLGGLLFGLLAAVAVPLAARLFIKFKTSRRQTAFADQLDDSLQLMASSLRAGHSIMRAMDSVSHEAASPTSEEFTRLVNETRVGRELGEALDEIAERTASEDFAWVAQAIAIQREVGGNLSEVMETAVNTMRERGRLYRHVRALSAEGRLSAYVLIALPVGVAAFMFASRGDYIRPLYTTFLGVVMLVTAVVLVAVGAFWLSRVIKVRV
jgi:tight adherence protein B